MNKYIIPFNKPYLIGNELKYIKDAVDRGKISGNGYYTQKCHEYFQQRYGFKKCLLTTSCTDALEMAAILCNIEPGDDEAQRLSLIEDISKATNQQTPVDEADRRSNDKIQITNQ